MADRDPGAAAARDLSCVGSQYDHDSPADKADCPDCRQGCTCPTVMVGTNAVVGHVPPCRFGGAAAAPRTAAGMVCGFRWPTIPEFAGGRCLVGESHPVHHGEWKRAEPNHDFEPLERRHTPERRLAAAESGASPVIPEGFEAKLTADLKDAYAAEVARLDHRLLYGPAAEDRGLAALRDAATDVRNSHKPNEWDSCVACRKDWPCDAELLAHAALAALPHGEPARTPQDEVAALSIALRRVAPGQMWPLAHLKEVSNREFAELLVAELMRGRNGQ